MVKTQQQLNPLLANLKWKSRKLLFILNTVHNLMDLN